MESKRQEKIGRLIQKEISILFNTELSHLGMGAMLTITKAKITSDLSLAKVYVSLLAAKDNKAVVDNLNKHEKEIRFAFGKVAGKQLRIIPHLRFYEDDSLDYYENIDNLLKND
ncbi:MAG: ribosome-binding factor A [Bacteroidia bacterium]|nr:MAG: ribosome-binding factor A [Bacteroidia bacterium]